jgi:hypothetical protein
MKSVATFDLNNMQKCNDKNVSSQQVVLVKIINLKINTELNNIVGILNGYNVESKRYEVYVCNRIIRVLPINICNFVREVDE